MSAILPGQRHLGERIEAYSRSDKERLDDEGCRDVAAGRNEIREHHALAYLSTACETELYVSIHTAIQGCLDA